MKNKLKIMVVVLLMVLLVMNTLVLAASEPTLKLNASSTSVKTGEEFKITVSQKFEDGATGIICDLKYDDKVLEFKKCNSLSDWFASVEDEDSGKVLDGLITSEPQKKGDVCELVFKVKDDYTEKTETKIELTTNDVTDISNDIYSAKDIGITINVNDSSDAQTPTNTSENTPTNNTSNDNTSSNIIANNTSKNNTTNNTTNNTSRNNTTNNTSRNNTTNNTSRNNTTNNASRNNTTNNASRNNTTNNTSSSLPKTGSGRGYTLLIIVGLAGIAYASYMGYRKYKDI